ncbi:MAG TPA: GNAT family N-acyltransferase [Bryobacteraceae bacterium]|nr:GNAT family N-acyltransferase [Bryobacteraceae bacterium]
MSLAAILDAVVAVPEPIRGMATRLLGLHQLDALIRPDDEGQSIPDRLLHRLAVTCRAAEKDLRRIPHSGPVVIVANHPFGILEGAALAAVLPRVRSDVRFLANSLLSAVQEIQDLLIPVDPIAESSAAHRNCAGLRRAIAFLQSGGCLVVFPAGEVSHFQVRNRAITDSEWHTAVARMIEIAWRKGAAVSIVPIHIEGSNSLLFQTLGLIHASLRTMLMARELLNKRNRLVELRIGSPIASKKLLGIPTPKERTEYLRWRTYLLAARSDFKARTSLPMRNRARTRSIQPITPPGDPALLARELAELSETHLLTTTGELEVYIAPAPSIPNVLQEIGRLRELTFREAGEGTGKAADLDHFDEGYLHLFAWKPAGNEIVGAYRLAGTDRIRELYTRTLFRYPDSFLDRIGPALELGRSFVRPEYQRAFAPLLALWKGIGVYVARNPRYAILFGPVSISNQYQAASRELMVTFLEKHASLEEWTNVVSNRNPSLQPARARMLPAARLDIEDLSDIISDLEPTRIGMPVLLRQYLKLGGKLLGFNVDPEFSNALDGLIMVDLTKTEPRLLKRYLGETEASEFLKCH